MSAVLQICSARSECNVPGDQLTLHVLLRLQFLKHTLGFLTPTCFLGQAFLQVKFFPIIPKQIPASEPLPLWRSWLLGQKYFLPLNSHSNYCPFTSNIVLTFVYPIPPRKVQGHISRMLNTESLPWTENDSNYLKPFPWILITYQSLRENFSISSLKWLWG